MNRKIRFGVYGLVALFILLTYFIQESKQQNTLPIIGKVPHFDLIDSQNN